MSTVPYWRLSAFHLFYFASYGALLPYLGLYLKSLGFNAQTIGELFAIIMLTKIGGPNFWGWIADRTGKHMTMARLASFLTVLIWFGVIGK